MDLPWGAWHGDQRHSLTFPTAWTLDYLEPKLEAESTREDIAAALDHPISSDSLTTMASRARSVCIVTDDLARPTPLASIMQEVTARLCSAGLPDSAIQILVATGAHRALAAGELEQKLGGSIVRKFQVESHDLRRLARTPLRYGDAALCVNATYLAADLKILIGSPLPHAFAGTSGGAKLVIPGLADLDATVRSHKFVLMGLRGSANATRSTFREHIEGLVKQLGVHFTISVVTNAQRKVVGVYAGDLVESHRAASERASTLYDTPLHGVYDCLVLNAYPKDTDLIQSENAFVALKRTVLPIAPDGLVVLTTAASEGVGRHGLFEPGGAAYRRPVMPRALRGCELWLYAPNVSRDEAHRLFPDECEVFRDSGHLADALERRFSREVRCGILPAAPMQLIRTQATSGT